MVANIAWHRIQNEDTKAWIETILGPQNGTDDAGSPLAAVADWADRVRHFKPWSGPLHYIDVRDDLYKGGCHYTNNSSSNSSSGSSNAPAAGCSFDYERDCPNDICVAGAILNYTSQLLDEPTSTTTKRTSSTSTSSLRQRAPDPWLKNQALRFVTHFIGDIHQPLHCSRTTDKGGNDYHVHFNFNLSSSSPLSRRRDLRRSSRSYHHSHHSWNLHSVWDTGIIEVALQRDYQNSRSIMETDLLAQSFQDKDAEEKYLKCASALHNQTCTEIWGQESFAMALEYAYEMESGEEVVDGSTLTEEYYETRLPIVKDRLIAAGVRLAATLEAIYDYESERSTKKHLLSNLRLGFAMY
eukprot:CAMPEP_0117005448 /NCGR_PEP_ID=MMETSP0472-20121206/6063_1 /TAXON_ID=693140 ORGANISM="Tiarina fusus, Strain LIS" /NCGR_SAMPLE_ID=MMETSP0472 /ASSEMBLY_ACC=CAM_ASM_000603 /LENGTH=353 /DNA_ID=CAMNT_0004706697 /DNA_START=291 /DNA_END=1352 /DNA_ORIENTATION=-